MSENTTTPTVDDEFEQRLHRHNAAGDIRTIGCLMDMYPPRHGPGKRRWLSRRRWVRLRCGGSAATAASSSRRLPPTLRIENICGPSRSLRTTHAGALRPSRDLCDEDGMVLGRDGKRVLESDGYEIWCRHGKPVDLDDEDD